MWFPVSSSSKKRRAAPMAEQTYADGKVVPPTDDDKARRAHLVKIVNLESLEERYTKPINAAEAVAGGYWRYAAGWEDIGARGWASTPEPEPPRPAA